MKAGDLIRHYDADCGTGIVIEDPRPAKYANKKSTTKEDVLVLWSDGLTEWCDPEMVEVVE